MNDNFYPSVTWSVPVSESNLPTLTSIWRDQSFTTWLVGVNQASGETVVLQTVRWRMRLHIAVDPDRPLGSRATLLEPSAQDPPRLLGKNQAIPPNAMVRPNANDAQVLMWRPRTGDPALVIPPKYWDSYRSFGMWTWNKKKLSLTSGRVEITVLKTRPLQNIYIYFSVCVWLCSHVLLVLIYLLGKLYF